MYYSKLRAALKAAFPTRYHFLTWKNLLADFVDLHLEAFLIKRSRYELARQSNPNAPYPTFTKEDKEAIVLLARQQNHSYLFLATAYFVQSRELALSLVEADHYRRQATGMEQWGKDYQRLADKALAQLGPQDNL